MKVALSLSVSADYLPEMKSRFNTTELEKMYHWHALPENWEQMDYREFLEQRRELIAQIIFEGYQTLSIGRTEQIEEQPLSIDEIVNDGETSEVEFKSTLRVNLHTGSTDRRMEMATLKTIAGFLNTNGGILTIGIADDGTPVGIDNDGFENEDKMSLHLVNLVKNHIGPTILPYIQMRFEDYNGYIVMKVECSKGKAPVFVKDSNIERFYIRTGPSTTELSASQIQEYIGQRFRA